MFRRQEATLPPDPTYPDDLEKLGYFITQDGFIKLIADPELNFNFHHTNDDRHNDVHREAMHRCTRRELYSRLADLGIARLYLPFLTAEPPPPSEEKAHIPILATPADVLKTRKRVIILVNDSRQDLGVLAYRLLHRSYGLHGGSVINFIKEIKERSVDVVAVAKMNCDSSQNSDSDSSDGSKAAFDIGDPDAHPNAKMTLAKDLHEKEHLKKHPLPSTHAGEPLSEETSKAFLVSEQQKATEHKNAPGIIVMNTGQLYFSYKRNEAMTIVSWDSLTRKSHMHPPVNIDRDQNMVEGNRSPQEHIKFVFDNVINNPKFVSPDAEIYVVGIESGAKDLLILMNNDGPGTLSPRQITALALIHPGTTADELTNPDLASFLRHRARTWVQPEEDEQVNTLVSQPREASPKVTIPVGARQKKIDWLEETDGQQNHDASGGPQHHSNNAQDANPSVVISINATPHDPTTTTTTAENLNAPFSFYEAPLCPTFSGGPGEEGVADHPECVFPRIYTQVLDFFEEVAQDPFKYQNPAQFSVADAGFMSQPPSTDVHLTTEEQAQLAAQMHMMKVRDATLGELTNLPPRAEDLAHGISGGAGAGSGNWVHTTGGPKVEFAGLLVDQQLLKDAGLEDEDEGEGDGGVALAME